MVETAMLGGRWHALRIGGVWLACHPDNDGEAAPPRRNSLRETLGCPTKVRAETELNRDSLPSAG